MANAQVTVTFGDESFTFELAGSELSEATQNDGSVHRYFTNASRDFVGTEVERGLVKLFKGKDLPLVPVTEF